MAVPNLDPALLAQLQAAYGSPPAPPPPQPQPQPQPQAQNPVEVRGPDGATYLQAGGQWIKMDDKTENERAFWRQEALRGTAPQTAVAQAPAVAPSGQQPAKQATDPRFEALFHQLLAQQGKRRK